MPREGIFNGCSVIGMYRCGVGAGKGSTYINTGLQFSEVYLIPQTNLHFCMLHRSLNLPYFRDILKHPENGFYRPPSPRIRSHQAAQFDLVSRSNNSGSGRLRRVLR